MKNKNSLLLISIIALLLQIGCNFGNNKKLDQSNVKIIPVTPFSKDKINLSSFATDIKYIPLETPKGHTIAHIKKIFYNKGKFYIVDYKKKHSVYCFNIKGKFLFEINNVGKGPGEYIELTDACLTYNKGSLALADISQNKILFYDLNGVFINEQKLPKNLYFSNFCMHKDFNVLLAQSSLLKDAPDSKKKKPTVEYAYNHFTLYNYITTPSDFSNTNFGFKVHNMATEGITLNSPFDIHNNSIYSTYAYNDTIYKIDDKSITPTYAVDFGDNKIPKRYTSDSKNEVYMKLYNDESLGWAGILDQIVISNNFIGFNYATAKNNINSTIYIRNLNHSINFSQVENDINSGPLGIIAGKDSDSTIISYVEAYSLIDNYEKFSTPENDSIFDTVEYNDNPIITLISIK